MPSLQTERTLAYPAKDVFALIGDIESYPEFLPWCVGARITEGSCEPLNGGEVLAELMVRFKMFQESYISRVNFEPADKEDGAYVVDTQLKEGPFKHLHNRWEVTPIDAGCRVDFTLEFAFANKLLNKLIGGMFEHASAEMIDAFEKRAKEKLSS